MTVWVVDGNRPSPAIGLPLYRFQRQRKMSCLPSTGRSSPHSKQIVLVDDVNPKQPGKEGNKECGRTLEPFSFVSAREEGCFDD